MWASACTWEGVGMCVCLRKWEEMDVCVCVRTETLLSIFVVYMKDEFMMFSRSLE